MRDEKYLTDSFEDAKFSLGDVEKLVQKPHVAI